MTPITKSNRLFGLSVRMGWCDKPNASRMSGTASPTCYERHSGEIDGSRHLSSLHQHRYDPNIPLKGSGNFQPYQVCRVLE